MKFILHNITFTDALTAVGPVSCQLFDDWARDNFSTSAAAIFDQGKLARIAPINRPGPPHPNAFFKYSMLLPAITSGPSSNLNTSTDT